MPPKLSSSVRDAIRRTRENQQFNLALEVLINHDSETSTDGALYRSGFVSEFIRLDALTQQQQSNSKIESDETAATSTSEAATLLETIKQQEKEEQEKQQQQQGPRKPSNSASKFDLSAASAIFSSAENPSLFARNLWNGEFPNCNNRKNQQQQQNLLETPLVHQSSKNGSVGTKLQFLNNLQTNEDSSTSTSSIFDFSTSTAATAGSILTVRIDTSNDEKKRQQQFFDGDDDFQWFRNRTAKLDRFSRTATAKGERLYVKDLVKKVIL